MRTILSTILCFIISYGICMSAMSTEQLADSAYNKENYAEAIHLYQESLVKNGRSSDVYYNLGNAYYRSGNLAQAVLAYERALRVDPSNKDARINLDFVNSKLEDKPEDNNSFLTRAHHGVVTFMSANAWAWMAFIVFAMLCGAMAMYILSSNVMIRKAGFFSGIILLALVIYFVIVASDASSRINNHDEAVVTAPSTLLNSVPRQPKQTEKVVPLHEGTKVEIIDSVSTPDDPVSPRWYNVRINGSNSAWLRGTDVERI